MAELTALAGLLGLSGAFALVGAVLAGWMAWRIVEKAGLPGWAGLGGPWTWVPCLPLVAITPACSSSR